MVMKKFLKIISSCFLAVLLLFATACAGVPSTLKSAKDKMVKKGYRVTMTEYDKKSYEYEMQGLKGILYIYDNIEEKDMYGNSKDKEVLALTAYLYTDTYWAEKKEKEIRKNSVEKPHCKITKKWLLVEGPEPHQVYAISVFES